MNKLVGIEQSYGGSWIWLYWVKESEAKERVKRLEAANPEKQFRIVTTGFPANRLNYS